MGSGMHDYKIPLKVSDGVDLERLYRKLSGISGHNGVEIGYDGVVFIGLHGGMGHQKRILRQAKRVITVANRSVVTG